jgi:23S rRNA (adenine2503-C2)-methyltransferase
MVSKIHIFRYTQKKFTENIFRILGRGKLHAKTLYSDWYRKGKVSSSSDWIEKQAQPLVEEMIKLIDFSLPELSMKKEENKTVKFLLKYRDSLESESVVIPMESGVTLCVSSQIGCAMGCSFCETGKMGLLRNLTADEIVAQVFYARIKMGYPVRNIVFMGMGEPLDNFEHVMQAISILTDEGGLGFGPSRITISTSGRIDGIYRLMEESNPALNLAISINAPHDSLRDRLMPINKKWNMAELKKAMLAYCKHPRRQILIGYVLLRGINDSLECANLLADYLQGLRVKVNLIPYNPQSRDRFSATSNQEIDEFAQALRGKGIQTLLRNTKGQKIMAACGQLGNVQQRKVLQKNVVSCLDGC